MNVTFKSKNIMIVSIWVHKANTTKEQIKLGPILQNYCKLSNPIFQLFDDTKKYEKHVRTWLYVNITC